MSQPCNVCGKGTRDNWLHVTPDLLVVCPKCLREQAEAMTEFRASLDEIYHAPPTVYHQVWPRLARAEAVKETLRVMDALAERCGAIPVRAEAEDAKP